MNRLLKSSKFLVLCLDVVISLTSYFVTKYVNPDAAKDVLFAVGALQPVFLTLIGSIAYEDGQAKAGAEAASVLSEAKN